MKISVKWPKLVNLLVLVVITSVVVCSSIFLYTATMSKPAPNTKLPTPDKQSGARAQCKDGYYSYSISRAGTCSGHKGVDKWL